MGTGKRVSELRESQYRESLHTGKTDVSLTTTEQGWYEQGKHTSTRSSTSRTLPASLSHVMVSVDTQIYGVYHIRGLLRDTASKQLIAQCNSTRKTTLQPHVTGPSEIWLSDTKESKASSNLHLQPYARLTRRHQGGPYRIVAYLPACQL